MGAGASLRKKSALRTVGWKRVSKAKSKPNGIPKLTKKLDAVFSQYIRRFYADENGQVSCYTCGHTNHYKKMQAGHYVSRFYKPTRWDEKNTRVQCAMCNMWKNGDLVNFREKLVAEIGREAVEALEAKRKEEWKVKADWYEEQITHYRALVEKV